MSHRSIRHDSMNSTVMTLLHEHVPLTLLCDLASTADPDSDAINRAERPARDPIQTEVAEHARLAAANAGARWRAAAG
ncbi:MAG TPA: hypothetical protein VME70_05740 [Mycobacteriales bacterium]|nr:hypothetical protein [Mycobacteriales bacterium]